MRICFQRSAACCFLAALLSAITASAQSDLPLHIFSTATHFYAPLVQGPDGTFYGVSSDGGISDFGAVFQIQPDGSRFTILHSFAGGGTISGNNTNADGSTPVANLVVSNNVLYGTTRAGGVTGFGTVFKLNTDGSGFADLHFFTNGAGGSAPVGGLVLAGGTLYGSTSAGGGAASVGTLFKINIDGTGFTNFYTFSGTIRSVDGAYPMATLILSGSTLYGTSEEGGTNGAGTVFRIDTNGLNYATLHPFAAVFTGTNIDGSQPLSTLVLSGGTLYGTASVGGRDYGAVFAVNTDGSGFTNLYTFHNLTDGSMPRAGLVLAGGTLYGTASAGGTSPGYGNVYKIGTDGSGFTNLYNFTGGTDGATPYAGLVYSSGKLYGATLNYGSGGGGAIFELNTNGSGFTVLSDGNDGSAPEAGLIMSGSTVYGTTSAGGAYGSGTVFQVNTDGTSFAILHTFGTTVFNSDSNQYTNADGATPVASLLLSGSTFYGTAKAGGVFGYGIIFSVSTNGAGFTNLYNFTNGVDGANPEAALALSGSTLYGTAYNGGSNHAGGIFAINTNGTGFADLYSFSPLFDNTNGDGDGPMTSLALSGSTLYGTTYYGGTNGGGTLFKINTSGSGFTNFHNFNMPGSNQTQSNAPDGTGPDGNLFLSGNTLYGTAQHGGAPIGNKVPTRGTIFKVNTDGTGFVRLYAFTNGIDGENPQAGVVLSGSTLYGTSESGIGGGGAVVQVDTNGNNTAVLHSFAFQAGTPMGTLVLAGNTLYGTTEFSSPGSGAVFAVNPGFVPTVAFTASPTTGLPPLTVQFTAPAVDSGGNTILYWRWAFGDGTNSTLQNPIHTYATNITYFPTLIATNNLGETLVGSGPAIVVAFSSTIQNAGFETGTFTNWVLGGQSSSVIGTTTNYVHSGAYGAELYGVGGLGSLTQTIETIPGANYVISFWLHYKTVVSPSDFKVLWGGQVLMNMTNPPAFGWTNLQFDVQATATSEILGFEYEYIFGLDDVSVELEGSAQPGIAQISLSGTNLVVNGSGGQSGQTYYLLMGTNLTEPIAQWIPVASNTPASDGNFSLTATNAVSPGTPQRYFILLAP